MNWQLKSLLDYIAADKSGTLFVPAEAGGLLIFLNSNPLIKDVPRLHEGLIDGQRESVHVTH